MSNRIGVMVENFKRGVLGGIDLAAESGIGYVQISVGTAEADVRTMDCETAKEIFACVRQRGLQVSALCGDLGGHGLMDESEQDWRVAAHEKQILLANDWACPVLTMHIGVVPPDPAHPRYDVMRRGMARVGAIAEKRGVTVAIETGPETPETLRAFIGSLGVGGVGVNYDPANLAMVWDLDVVAGVKTLAQLIVHTHAKDGRMLRNVGAETVYRVFGEGGIEDTRLGPCFEETPLGEGAVPWDAYIRALDEVGYKGIFTIEREGPGDAVANVTLARDFLRGMLK